MPPKRRFRPPPQVLRNKGKMCEPAMLYLVISVLGLIMIVMQNTSSDVYCMGTYECERVSKPTAFIIQVFYIAFWTWLLNTLCKNGYKNISWIIVLFPFLLYAAAVFGLASSGVFHVREGADVGLYPKARKFAEGGNHLELRKDYIASGRDNIHVVIGRKGSHTGSDRNRWKSIKVPLVTDGPYDNTDKYIFGKCDKAWAEAPARGMNGSTVLRSGGKTINSDVSKVACWVPKDHLSQDGKDQYDDTHMGAASEGGHGL